LLQECERSGAIAVFAMHIRVRLIILIGRIFEGRVASSRAWRTEGCEICIHSF
jgi:hypothetical protein